MSGSATYYGALGKMKKHDMWTKMGKNILEGIGMLNTLRESSADKWEDAETGYKKLSGADFKTPGFFSKEYWTGHNMDEIISIGDNDYTWGQLMHFGEFSTKTDMPVPLYEAYQEQYEKWKAMYPVIYGEKNGDGE